MVNGHTLDAVLALEFRAGPYWGDYLWFRGMVSVAFMFVAGFAFHLATLARFEKHRSRPQEIRKRFRRGVDLIIIGYLLRFPFDYLHRLGDIPNGLSDVLLRCNVLQCIGVTLIILEALTVWCRSPRQVVLFAGLLAAGATLIAPLTDPLVPGGVWQVFLSYVSHQSGSLFPLIPWSTFMLSGAVIGYLSAAIEWASYTDDPDAWKDWWENPEAESFYFVGKDNIPFHTVIWPAMLMGYGELNLPTNVPANQYITPRGKLENAVKSIRRELDERVRWF